MATSSGSVVSAGVEFSSDDITPGDGQSAVEIYHVTCHGVLTENASYYTQLTHSLTQTLVNTQTHTHDMVNTQTHTHAGVEDPLCRFVAWKFNSWGWGTEFGGRELATTLNPVLSSIAGQMNMAEDSQLTNYNLSLSNF